MGRSSRADTLALTCVVVVVLSSAAPAPVAGERPAPRAAATTARPAPAPPAAPAVRAAAAPSSTPAPAYPPQFRVGAVFSLTGRPRHFCTGSVVDSPYRDLVITAAHCVHNDGDTGYRTGLAFAPGLRQDGTPAGLWHVAEALAAPEWMLDSDPGADVAFLVLAPLAGREIEDVVGGNPIAFDRPPGGPVQLIGYPRDDDDPVLCDGTAEGEGADQLRVGCPGFSGGTSGGPWLSDPEGPAGSGAVTGVIGGYQHGGDTPDVSYSSYFGPRVRALYEQAAQADPQRLRA